MECKFSSSHYDFYYAAGSSAERDIHTIAEYQEECFIKITQMLKIHPEFRIKYYLFETSLEVGVAYDGQEEPCNGFTRMPDSIYAVYNEQEQCIGMHEDTHIISYSRKRPDCAFLREGLAMYMDETWLGRPNAEWVYDFLQDGRYVPVGDLADNAVFFEKTDRITYPIAGAFVAFLVQRMGMQKFLNEVYYAEDFSFRSVEEPFLRWITDNQMISQ